MADVSGRSIYTSRRGVMQISAVATLVACFLTVHLLYIERLQPDALYMDSLRLLAQLRNWQNGALPLYEFWLQGTAHHGLVNQFFLLMNVELLQLDVLLYNRLTGIVIGTLAFTCGLLYLRESSGQALSWVQALVLVFIVGLPFGWAGFELLTLDLGLPLWFKNLTFVLSFVLFDRITAKHASQRYLPLVMLCLLLPVIVLLVGMGWSFSFIGALLLCQLALLTRIIGARRRFVGLVPVLFGVGALGLYVAIGSVSGGATEGPVRDLGALAQLPFYAIGSSWLGGETVVALTGSQEPLFAFGAISVLVALSATASWISGGARGSLLPLLLILYGGLVACSLSVGRSDHGPAGVIASRYYQDVVLFLVGSLWMAARELSPDGRAGRKWGLAGFAVILAALALAQGATQFREWKAAPYRAAVFDAMNRATLRGVSNADDSQLLQAPLADAQAGARVMRERELGVFAGLPTDYCEVSETTFGNGWYPPESGHRWFGRKAALELGVCPCPLDVSVYVPEGMSSRTISARWREGGELLAEQIMEPGQTAHIQLDVDDRSTDVTVYLQSSAVTVPARTMLGSSDVRELGALVLGAGFACEFE